MNAGGVCAACGKALVRRSGERFGRWVVRDFCDRSCYQRLRVAGIKPHSPAAEEPPRRECPVCDTVLVRRPGERMNRWSGRVYCSKSCSARHATTTRSTGVESKRCKGCGGVMVWDRAKMSASRWQRSKYCSTACSRPASSEPVVVPSADRQTAPIAEAPPAAPAPVWRPSGWSPVPNAMAGHRPADAQVAS